MPATNSVSTFLLRLLADYVSLLGSAGLIPASQLSSVTITFGGGWHGYTYNPATKQFVQSS